MVITAIERQKRRPERVNIYIDGEFALGVHQSVLLKSGYREGDVVDEGSIKRLESVEEVNAAKEKALRLIGHRMRSEKELVKRLTDKGFAPAVVDAVMLNLRENNLVDDRKFAAAFVHDSILKKKAGRGLLRRDLRTKGIDPQIIESTLAVAVDPADEETRALAAARSMLKRYASSARKTDPLGQRRRLNAWLGRRGYDFSIIRNVTNKLFGAESADDSAE